MTTFVASYFAILTVLCCVSAYFRYKTALTLLIVLAVFSAAATLVNGSGGVRAIATAAGCFALAAGASYAFRQILVRMAPPGLARELRTAPLTASFGMLVILGYAMVAIFAPWIAPYGEAEIVASPFSIASADLLLGADQLGRDMLSRLIFGARNSVGLALAATSLAFLVGAIAGLWAATRGGWIDQLTGRIADVLMSIPSLIFALLILSIFGTNLIVIVIVVAVIYTPRVFRLTRAVAGNIVVMDYIEAARLRGEGDWYLIRKEILPNAAAPLTAEFGLEFCFVFLLIAGLSFLGLGIQPPTADWGSMVRETATLISYEETTPLIPAAAIAILAVAVNFVVDWMTFRSSGLKEH